MLVDHIMSCLGGTINPAQAPTSTKTQNLRLIRPANGPDFFIQGSLNELVYLQEGMYLVENLG